MTQTTVGESAKSPSLIFYGHCKVIIDEGVFFYVFFHAIVGVFLFAKFMKY